ncbi:MAG: single-stranded-DNA-specific exonuclease RecJ [Lewinellaceae bacterium]|nr:single-stranded-DNA-specific exonuclease RecJ [Lewinellaceae bacterium]
MPAQRWRLLPVVEATAQHLHETLRISPLLCRMLAQRGISSFDEARQFFRPRLDELHDPFLMKDMDAAVSRLEKALQLGERILLYGDYDVDGTTSVALLYTFLSDFTQNLDYYLPDRDKEGYGLSLAGVEYARAGNAALMVVMDCGIKAHRAIELAATYGIDVIVCDHHLPDDTLPQAVAVLDPKRSDCPYPNDALSGCGVVFKLVQAFALRQNTDPAKCYTLLDLVAVSICCDLVPITGENRIMTHFGMQVLNREPRLGLWALIQRSGRNYPLEVSDVVFGIGPMINAAGRLGDAREAVRVLLSADRNSALEAAATLRSRNRERREVDQHTAGEARRRVERDPDFNSRKSIVQYDPGWHKGIIGIVASRLVEQFHRPTVVLTQSGGRAVGSARSVPGFDLHAALSSCEHLFNSFGGHAHAAGLQMPVENVPDFTAYFEKIVCETISEAAETPELEISGNVNFEEITPRFWRTLRQFAPFGPGNMAPVFRATGVHDTGRSRLLADNHVRLSVRQNNGPVFTGIGFGLGNDFSEVKSEAFDLAFTLFEDQWHGERVLALMVKGITSTL